MHKYIYITFLLIGMACLNPLASDYDHMVNKFYGDLALIIEQNMNAPNVCVEKVYDYYKQNEKTIKEIQAMSQRYVMQAKAMMETYEWTESEGPQIEGLELAELESGMRRPQDSPGAKRYVKAMEEFGSKHPHHAIKISVKSAELAYGPTKP